MFLSNTLIAAAASQCQTLGYHRGSTYRNLDSTYAEAIRRIFWTIYVFDKNTALLLGRASHVQDFEIDVQYPPLTQDPSLRPWNEAFILAIRLAKIQGRFTNAFTPQKPLGQVSMSESR